MKILVITNSKKTFMGLRLSGIKGVMVSDKQDCEKEWSGAITNRDYGLILIDLFVYRNLKPVISEHERKLKFPLVLVIPGNESEDMPGDNLTDIIRETIGIKV